MAREWFVKEKKQAEVELGLREAGSDKPLVLKWKDIPVGFPNSTLAELGRGDWCVSIIPSATPIMVAISINLNKTMSLAEYKEIVDDSDE